MAAGGPNGKARVEGEAWRHITSLILVDNDKPRYMQSRFAECGRALGDLAMKVFSGR
jgi:hypothetical protein